MRTLEASKRAPTICGEGFSRVFLTRQGGASKWGKVLRKIVIGLLVVIVVLVITGCGGGEPTPSTEVTPSISTSPAGGTTATVSITKLEVPRKFTLSERTPTFFKEALEKKEPILLMFYSPTDIVSNKLREVVRKVNEDVDYQGKFILLLLDIDDIDKTFVLAEEFGVGDIPQLSILDAEGNVVREFRGESEYIDETLLKQVLYNIIKKPK